MVAEALAEEEMRVAGIDDAGPIELGMVFLGQEAGDIAEFLVALGRRQVVAVFGLEGRLVLGVVEAWRFFFNSRARMALIAGFCALVMVSKVVMLSGLSPWIVTLNI